MSDRPDDRSLPPLPPSRQQHGRTPSGRQFAVPHTTDLLEHVFNKRPLRERSLAELLTVASIVVQCAVCLAWLCGAVPSLSRWHFLLTFVFWRLAYDAGLGWILYRQSTRREWSQWCARYAFGGDGSTDKSWVRKRFQWLVSRELRSTMTDPQYRPSDVPEEFNAWLLFRGLVDVILVSDFTAYVAFAVVWASPLQVSSLGLLDVLRWLTGLALIAFNLVVKLDAHRVVQDFAWYWGDFFFLIDSTLTFDGVFEMAPHPMYSVGYSGYYGISLITNSYVVLVVSVLAHMAQFLFLYFVEEPHIRKTYGVHKDYRGLWLGSGLGFDNRAQEILFGPQRAYFRSDPIGLYNLDWFRASDLMLVWAVGWTVVVAGLWHGGQAAWVFLALAGFWRSVHTFLLGGVLAAQSRKKFFTRHFIKHGHSHHDAFASWKTIFNFSLTMTWVSFVVAAFKFYQYPDDGWWAYISDGELVVRHVLGAMLLLLHLWMSVSVFEVLGIFGFYYGDFFIEEFTAELQYSGIYRYLNNPEKTLGHAAFWGIALMTGSKYILLLTLFSHLSNWWFLEYVEAPHMRKLYGDRIRKESGVTRAVKSRIASPLQRHVPGDVNTILHDIRDFGAELERLMAEKIVSSTEKVKNEIERIVELVKPRLDELLSETRGVLSEAQVRMTALTAEERQFLDDTDLTQYSLEIVGNNGGDAVPSSGDDDAPSTRPPSSTDDDLFDSSTPLQFELGQPIRAKWRAPTTHSTQDWIGLYEVSENASDNVTTVSSQGRWMYLEHAGTGDGEVVFSGDRLPWRVGTYEFRLHYNEKYIVLATSTMFRVHVEARDEPLEAFLTTMPMLPSPAIPASVDDLAKSPISVQTPLSKQSLDSPTLPPGHPNAYQTIVTDLLPIYRRVFERDDVSPQHHFLDDLNGQEHHARRIVYAIRLMYNIDFSWKVVMGLEPTLERVVERIQEARVVLAPAVRRGGDGGDAGGETNAAQKSLGVARYLRLLDRERQRRAEDRRRRRRKLQQQKQEPRESNEKPE